MSQLTRRTFLKQSATILTAATCPAGLLAAQEAPPDARALFSAAARGDVEGVGAVLARAPGLIGARDADGRSAFAVALLRRHRAVGDLLRARGYAPDLHELALAGDWEAFAKSAAEDPSRVNAGHPIGGSAMTAAAIGGAGPDLWRVYQYGADPNARPTLNGEPARAALLAAFDYPEMPVVELTAATLLGNGADPNPPAENGVSPLHLAARRGSLELTEMLIRVGAVVDGRDADGHTPRALAAQADHKQVVALLDGHEAIPRDHQETRRAFDAAGRPYAAPADLEKIPYAERGPVVGAAHFDLDRVKAAVERDPRLAHAVATTTEGAVEAAAHTGRRPIVEFLLEHGAPYSLTTAVSRNDIARVRTLLRENPRRVNERGAHDFALLWYCAIGAGSVPMAEVLLEAGAQVERQHHLGTTALHFAVRARDKDLIVRLIEGGADVNRVGRKFDAAGQTPLQMARADGAEEIARLLVERGARA